jgi:hypothetical protein
MSANRNDFIGDFNFTRFASRPFCKVLAVYEDQHARTEIASFCERLDDRVPSCRIEAHYWNEKHPEVLGTLIEAATMADIVIVAGAASEKLPDEIQAALDFGFADRRCCGGVLVAFLGRFEESWRDETDLADSLKVTAERGALEFIPIFYKLPETPAYSLDDIRERSDATSSTLAGILERDPTSRY